MRFIYLHGFASGPFSKKARYFQERFAASGRELLIPDLNGGDFGHLTISRQLRAIETAADGASVRLIGSSLGGYLAALYAARHLEVDRLVMMAPAFNFIARWHERLGPEAMSRWKEAGALAVESYADGCVHQLHYDFIADGARYDAWPEFHQPALIFHGQRDDVVPAQYSIDFARRHPNVELRLFGSGHDLLDVLDEMWLTIEPFTVG